MASSRFVRCSAGEQKNRRRGQKRGDRVGRTEDQGHGGTCGVDGAHPYRSIHRGPAYIPTYGAPGTGLSPPKLPGPKLNPLLTSYELSVPGPPVLHN